MFSTFKLGLALGLSIIISIGAQNLFVIKQGLRNEYPYLSALLCSLCDVLLISCGAMGISVLYFEFPFIKFAMLVLGVVMLTRYGVSALKRGYSSAGIQASLDKLGREEQEKISLLKLTLLGLSFSLLNPQAILDTTMIIGSSANQYTDVTKYYFVLGTMAASFIWFFGVAAATSALGKKIMSVRFWRWLEFVSGMLMMVFAGYFLWELVGVIN